jgi:hypothetical protein
MALALDPAQFTEIEGTCALGVDVLALMFHGHPEEHR